MSLKLNIRTLDDPDGHNPALLLKGDWLIIEISDGVHCGTGEASHSRDDQACARMIDTIFHSCIRDMELSPTAVQTCWNTNFATVDSFVSATAVSGLNQALHELIAKREGIPTWQLFTNQPARIDTPVYATINRALTSRTADDYLHVVTRAQEQGFTAIKCAPFEAVTPDGDQLQQSKYGLSILHELRKQFPDLSIRIDFHERFTLDCFVEILPEIQSLSPFWIEAPIPLGPEYQILRTQLTTPFALGELYYGREGFKKIHDGRWADVIMPDVKHVGGFGPLLDVCRHFSEKIESSPHNPSGPVATAASLHAAATCSSVTSLELPLIIDPKRAYYLDWMEGGMIRIPEGTGWGIGTDRMACMA